MKMSKRTSVVVSIVAIVVICLGLFVGIKTLSNYNAQKTSNQLTEVFDNVDYNMSIKQLSKLRGMILEVESLSHKNIYQSVIFD